MKVFYTETAAAEIDEICSYIERDSPIAAAEVAAAIQRTVDRLAKRPKSAPAVHGEKCGRNWWSDINIASFSRPKEIH
jgi:plasmid stabilization system protein ParE